jgi:hypothetical protein
MSDMRDRLTRIEKGREDPRVDVVELVNWVYSEQLAHLAAGRGSDYRWLLGNGLSGDGVARIAELNLLGVRVDQSSGDAGELHPVAETVHYLVGLQIKSMQSPAWLIPEFGKRKAVPPGFDLEISLGPTWKAAGPRYELDANGRMVPKAGTFKIEHDGSSWKIPVCCPLEFDHGPDFQAELRREYEHWHDALRRLVIACNGRQDLGRLIVTGPSLPREPWLDRGAFDVPSRPIERPATRAAQSPIEGLLLSILLAAHGGRIRRVRGGWWHELAKGEGLKVGESMVIRLRNQSLVAYRRDTAGKLVGLGVTEKGIETLRAASMIAA